MSHVYRVIISEATVIYVEADSKAQARSIALADIAIARLDGGAILALHRAGTRILTAPETPTLAATPAGIIDPTRSGINLPPIGE